MCLTVPSGSTILNSWVKSVPVSHSALAQFHRSLAILRMYPLPDHFEVGDALLRIKSPDAEIFLRPIAGPPPGL